MIGRFFSRVFYWGYSRGSWQWDLFCLFFLLVIFSTPQNFLLKYARNPMSSGQIHEILIGWLRNFGT